MKIVSGREISALLNPRPAVLVTCCDVSGRPNVLTVAWHTPISHRPPLVGISIAASRFSHGLIGETGEFVINVVGRALLEAVRVCGTHTGDVTDKFATAGLETAPAETIKPPVLKAALGVLECCVVEQFPAGDHTFFIGEVLHAAAQEDAFGDGWDPGRGDGVLQCIQRDRYGLTVELGRNEQG